MKFNQTQASVFLGIGKSIDPMKCWWSGERQQLLPLPFIVSNEFKVDYSWRVAIRQSSLPVRQPRLIVGKRSVDGKNYLQPVAGVS